MFGCWNVAMSHSLLGAEWWTVESLATQDIQAWDEAIWESLQCIEATLNMDQKVLKKLVESISSTVKSCKY